MIPNLGVGFPLRCFQRLSFPDIATEQCRWYDSSHTRGQFNSVLSYQSQIPSRINACRRQETNLSHACSHLLLGAMDYSFIRFSRIVLGTIAYGTVDVQSLRVREIPSSLGVIHLSMEFTDINRLDPYVLLRMTAVIWLVLSYYLFLNEISRRFRLLNPPYLRYLTV